MWWCCSWKNWLAFARAIITYIWLWNREAIGWLFGFIAWVRSRATMPGKFAFLIWSAALQTCFLICEWLMLFSRLAAMANLMPSTVQITSGSSYSTGNNPAFWQIA